jgi:membrane-associated protein
VFATLLASGFLDPQKMIEQGGLLLLSAIVFAETGLFVGFFLPGDSLLFIAGFLASSAGGNRLPALPIVVACVIAASILGSEVGYWFGRKVGPALFDRQKSRFFNPANVVKAHLFFERYGAKTIVLARFVPIVRTFAPIVAGVSTMRHRVFLTYNIVGAVLWGGIVTTLGYFLGQVDAVKNHIELAIVAVVAISLLPMAIEMLRHRRSARREPVVAEPEPAARPID